MQYASEELIKNEELILASLDSGEELYLKNSDTQDFDWSISYD